MPYVCDNELEPARTKIDYKRYIGPSKPIFLKSKSVKIKADFKFSGWSDGIIGDAIKYTASCIYR